ncbi:MAG: AAA family ATPase, partial [Gemmatimonadota bacterium]
MYRAFYNLAERPFELTPDPRYLFLSSHHREALAHLTYAVEERRGFVQLTGEIGTGKTMMLDALVMGLDGRTKVARLSHTTITAMELLGLLAREFGIEGPGEGKLELLAAIQGFLNEWTAAGRNTVLVVDEAQNLELPVLEEIRLLSNLRSQGLCSLQIVLAGQPEFRDKLEHPDLRQLKQRIGIRYHLTPLSSSETNEYIRHRLSVAGATSTALFDSGALDAVFAYAGGVPRMINIICDRALVAGYGANKKRVGRNLILETVEDIEGHPLGKAPEPDAVSAPVVAAAPVMLSPDVAVSPTINSAAPAGTAADVASGDPEWVPGVSPERRAVPEKAEWVPGVSPERRQVLAQPEVPEWEEGVSLERRTVPPEPERAGWVDGLSDEHRRVPPPRRRIPSWLGPACLLGAAIAVVAFVAFYTDLGRSLWDPEFDGATVASMAQPPVEGEPDQSAKENETKVASPGRTTAEPSAEIATSA